MRAEASSSSNNPDSNVDSVSGSSAATSLQQPTYNWKNVTQPFLEACTELDLGELLHDELFGLFEAMSAIEMMDPKMDAGMRGGSHQQQQQQQQNNRGCSSRKCMNFAQAVANNKLPMDDEIEAKDLVAIIDTTMACLVTWLEGHSLAQTVFTNLYLHAGDCAEKRPTNVVLKSFTVAVLKMIDLIRDLIAKASVFEEEDFQPLVYGFQLATDVSEAKAVSALREAEDCLQRTVRATKTDSESNEHQEAVALYARVKFTRLFYMGLSTLCKHELTDGHRHLTAAKDLVGNIVATLNLGTIPPSGENVIGFEPLVNQRLLPPTFPRYAEIRSRDVAYAHLSALIDRLLSATNVTQLNTYQSALEFFMDFGRSSPCVLSRSVLQLLYTPLQPTSTPQMMVTYSQATRLSQPNPMFQELLREACKLFIAPPALTFKTPPFNAKHIKHCLDSFFSQCCRPMGLLIQTFGHNCARQRDKIPPLLEEFAIVQEEADKLDTLLNAVLTSTSAGSDGKSGQNTTPLLFFSTWLLYHVLRLMVRHILSGFELELFSVHEFPYLYWYLYELLYPWLTTCLHRADGHLIEHEQMIAAEASQHSKSQGKTKKKAKNANKKKPRPYVREITNYQGYATMCAGYFKLLVGFKKERKILIPSNSFDNESVRYEHRFAPFNNLLTPPSMPYSQFLEVYSHTASTEPHVLYLAAARDFGRARQIFESVIALGSNSGTTEELNALIAVNKNNLVASSVLSKDSSRKVDFDFSMNNTFPTVKFV